MVTVLAARWQLGHELYRETGDVDLGIPPIVAQDRNLVGRLKELHYLQVAGSWHSPVHRSLSPWNYAGSTGRHCTAHCPSPTR